jgi:SNF2 family DNA or RNA helicase
LCGHVQDEEGIEHEIPENRTQALMDELEDYQGKAVVWFTYVQDLLRCQKRIKEEYGPKSVALFYGGNADDREEDEEKFKTDPTCRFMLATAGAGGRGRTWSVADRVIYFSNSDNLEYREQSEQRGLGVEKTRGVDYVDLVVPGTVDVKILEALRAKINMATAINGDNYREWLI